MSRSNNSRRGTRRGRGCADPFGITASDERRMARDLQRQDRAAFMEVTSEVHRCDGGDCPACGWITARATCPSCGADVPTTRGP